MKVEIEWKEGLHFSGGANNHLIEMDATEEHGGRSAGMSPKEMVLMGLCGCTGMDTSSLMKKFRQEVAAFNVSATASLTADHPRVFSEIHLKYDFKGESIDEGMCKKAVTMSMEKYCGVSAMLAKNSPIHYEIFLNNRLINSGSKVS